MSTVTERPTIGRQSVSSQGVGRRSTGRPESLAQESDRQGTSEADGLAVASFLLGLPGLLLFNIVLGPIAITLATLALVRGTRRRGRALLGLTLGIASLVILSVTIATSHGVLIDIGS
ncbi:DUF4190 domain-containing protein [Kitasatospora sp. NPDC057542]|uniref:DUF4190 domain-containing protein n=1 Tax=Streptomycetaceae TaxID=2062 RepID=UPI001CCD8D7C|nr:DUF4190 domain-containing protein [Streptomyces sp. LS1784]